MVEFLSNWAEQIIIAIVIASIIEMILPNNKNKKYIKMVIGIYILFTILSPIVGNTDVFSAQDLNIEEYAETNETETVNQTSMDSRIEELYIEELEKNITEKAEEEGYEVKSCKVDAVLDEGEANAGINKIELIISGKKESNQNESDSKINDVNKVEINVGLSKFTQSDSSKNEGSIENANFQSLKKVLSEYYEIDSNKIYISSK